MENALLLLDNDETLIYPTRSDLEIEISANVFDYNVYQRPFLKEFLETIKEDYKLAIWSSTSDDYLEEVIKQTILSYYQFEFVWGRSKATYCRNFEMDEERFDINHTDHYHFIKVLKKYKSWVFL